MQPDIWEEWWRPACVLDMQPAMWSTRCRRACVRSHAKRHTGCHQPEADWLLILERLRGQFSTDFESAPRDDFVQLNSSRPLSSFDDQLEMLSGVSSVLRVQISRSSARYSARRFCPSPDQPVEACQFLHGEAEVVSKTRSVQSTPVMSSIGFWPSLLRSTSCLSAKNTVSYNQLIAELFSCRIPLLEGWIMAGGRV
ncbi:hypothetical protein YC2023_010912 [Brassica napus]